MEPAQTTSLRFLIRAAGDPAPLVEPVRRALRDAVVGVNVNSAYTLRRIVTVAGQEYLAGRRRSFRSSSSGCCLR